MIKQRIEMARQLVAQRLGEEIGDVISGNVKDDPGLLKEHQKLMSLIHGGQNLKVTTTIRVENEDGISQVVEVVSPMVISGSIFKEA
jgi:hypothetical protein